MDKLKHQNKHLLNEILRQSRDKLRGPNKVGSTGLKVKQMVKSPSLPGGGLMGTKIKCLGPL